MSIFILGVVVGIACCLIAQWLYKLVEKLQCAHAAENSSGQFAVVIASPWEITLTPEGEYYHIDKNCQKLLGNAESQKQKARAPLQSLCKENEVNWCAVPEGRPMNVSWGSRHVSQPASSCDSAVDSIGF